MKSLIPNELSANFADPAVKRQLMAEYGDSSPFSGVNEDGEGVELSIYKDQIIAKTFQKNGWIRLNYYDEDGNPAGESYDGKWKNPAPLKSMSNERLIEILKNAVIAYESELDNQGYESEEEMHNVLLNEFCMTEAEYQFIYSKIPVVGNE